MDEVYAPAVRLRDHPPTPQDPVRSVAEQIAALAGPGRSGRVPDRRLQPAAPVRTVAEQIAALRGPAPLS